MADLTLYCLQFGLAAIFVAAGSAKLADQSGFRQTLVQLGVSRIHPAVVNPTALAIPVLEVVLGLSLVNSAWLAITSVCALAAMGAFTAVTAVVVSQRRSLRCRCFGMLSNSSFGWRTLARSLTLTGMALLLAVFHKLPQGSMPIALLILLTVGYLTWGLVVWVAAESMVKLIPRTVGEQ
jgi:hypothetical protein